MMTPYPDEGSFPNKYGSMDDSEQSPSHSRSLPRSSKSSYFTVGEQHPPHKLKDLRDPETGRGMTRRLAIAVLCGLAFLSGCGVSFSWSAAASRSSAASGGFSEIETHTNIAAAERAINSGSKAAAFASPLEYTALNFYHVRDGKPGQDYPWLKDVKLIEPHRETTLAVVEPRVGYDYRWVVRSGGSSSSSSSGEEAGEVQATATGAVTVVVLTQLDENVVVLEEVDGDGQVTNRLEETVLVKYVRREIRTLADDERGEVLDAMFTLWAVRVDGGNGKEIYGEDYADVYAISRMHLLATTKKTCDHFHDGMGFLVSHSLLSNTFEFSLQLINPKLTVPYWDFTIETTSASSVIYDPFLPYTRSELLSPEWFGTSDLEDNMVKDGRWANTAIPKDKKGNPGQMETDIYDKLRSPWSTNDRAYLSRGLGQACQIMADEIVEWPSCATHFNLTVTNDDFYSWVWDSMAAPHAPVHFWVGGVMDCAPMYLKIGKLVGTDIAKDLAILAHGHRRTAFCGGFWRCEGKDANVDIKPSSLLSSGTCGCLDYDLTQGDDYKEIMTALSYLEFYIGHFSEETQRQVVEALCSGVLNLGDMSQSSSSLDPMFWPIHPTMERLWQFAVLTEQVTDFNWPDSNVEVTLPDGSTYTQFVSSNDEDCFGHRGSDVFPFGLLDLDIDGFQIKTGIRSNPTLGNYLSNREVVAALDPRSSSLSYVYDTFKWEHCLSEGIDFDDAWDETAPSPQKIFFQSADAMPAVYTSFRRKMSKLMKEEGNKLKEEKEGEAPSG